MSLTTGEVKPLQPLDSGVVLIVGAKASNFDDTIKNHPRVVMWESQHQHWSGDKNIPSNTRAVFITRWVGHKDFESILSQTRKRNITMFRPHGTGIIIRQVKELLGLTRPIEPFLSPATPEVTLSEFMSVKQPELPVNTLVKKETKMAMTADHGKLRALWEFIDFSKTNVENANILLKKAQEKGIQTTLGSLAQGVSARRRGGRKVTKFTPTPTTSEKTDVTVQMLDNMIQELKDMRQFLIDTVKENKSLKTRMARFKELVGD